MKRGSNQSQEETGVTVWTQLIMTEIEIRNNTEDQHIDGGTSHDLLQDISTLESG